MILDGEQIEVATEQGGFAIDSLDIPLTNEQAMAVSRGGNAPQKTCAYGAQASGIHGDLTGASRSTATKREARRTDTSDFGLMRSTPEISGTPGFVRKI